MFDSNLCDRVIDIGLPAKDRKQYLLVMTPEKLFFYIGQLEPGLHIVVTIPEHASDVAPKRILRLLIHRLQIFLEKYECYCM